MLDLFSQLTLIIVLASLFGIIARWVKQPTLIAYLLAGVLIGTFTFLDPAHREVFDFFSDLGIVFLLFLVGLEINYASLRIVGRDAIIVGLGQIVFTFLLGFLLGRWFGFENLSAAYIAFSLTISSTIIVVNLLSEKKDLNSLYGKMSLGILLIQDFAVILVLVVLAGLGGGVETDSFLQDFLFHLPLAPISSVFAMLFFGIVLFLTAIWAGRTIIPRIFETVNTSHELLFVTGLAWLFGVTFIVDSLGFSKEIGGFLAGVTLANSYNNLQIAQRVKSLRDFFILIFFVYLGASITFFEGVENLSFEIIVFSLFVLIGNPLIVLFLMGFLGYEKRPSFFTGLAIAQISEFSLILAALGFKLGHIDERSFALISTVGVITIVASSYLILYANSLYLTFFRALSFFERKKVKVDRAEEKLFKKAIVLVGYHRTGQSVARALPADQLLIIDYDPETLADLRNCGYSHIFGDMIDDEVIGRIDFSVVQTVISTCPDIEDNLLFLKKLKTLRTAKNGRFKIILRAHTDAEGKLLYSEGADYVLLPHFTAGKYLAKIISQDPYLQNLSSIRARDIELIKNVC